MAERPLNRRAFIRACNRQADRDVERQERLDALEELADRAHISDSDQQSSGSSDSNNPAVNSDNNSDGREQDNNNDSDETNGSGHHEIEGNSDERDENSDEGGNSDESNRNSDEGEDEVSDIDRTDDSAANSGDSENVDDAVQFENDDSRTEFIRNALKHWTLDGGILSMRKLNKLLFLFHRGFPKLPLSYRTLLETPVNLPIQQLDGDCKFWYKGIEANLATLNLREYVEKHGCIKIDVNADGLPLFKRSKNKFWVLLGKLAHTKNRPFIVAIFVGKRDPNVAELCTDFVNEVQNIEGNGYLVDNVPVEVEIRRHICDATARAKLKCIIEHGGYYGCEKCDVEGDWIDHRMTYADINCQLRSDESFRNRDNPEHHEGRSPLEDTPSWRPVSGFVLDVLHLVHIGVYKRLIKDVWQRWVGVWRLPARAVSNISRAMVDLIQSCPSDFNRPPRPLSEMSMLTAKEYRRSLLYEGVVVFRDNQDENVYKHFLLLHVHTLKP